MGRAAPRYRAPHRPLGSSVSPVDDVMLAACQFVALPRNGVRADDLRRALGRVRPGLSPRLDLVIERAAVALDGPEDRQVLRDLLEAAKGLKGVRIAPGQEKWWDR